MARTLSLFVAAAALVATATATSLFTPTPTPTPTADAATTAETNYGEVVAMSYDLGRGNIFDQRLVRMDLNKPGKLNKFVSMPDSVRVASATLDRQRRLYYTLKGYYLDTYNSVSLKLQDHVLVKEDGIVDIRADSSTGRVFGILLHGGAFLVEMDTAEASFENHLYEMKRDIGVYMDGCAYDSSSHTYYVFTSHITAAEEPQLLEAGEQGPNDAGLFLHKLHIGEGDEVTESVFPMENTILSLAFSEPIGKVVGWQSGVGVVTIDPEDGSVETVVDGSNFHGHPNLYAFDCSAAHPVCYFNIQYMRESTHSVLVDVSTGDILRNDLNPGRHVWTKVQWQDTD